MADLGILPDKAVLLITDRIDGITAMTGKQASPGYYDLVGWCSKTCPVIDEIYGGDDYRSEEIRMIGLPACSCNSTEAIQMQLEIYYPRLLDYIDQIRTGMTTKE